MSFKFLDKRSVRRLYFGFCAGLTPQKRNLHGENMSARRKTHLRLRRLQSAAIHRDNNDLTRASLTSFVLSGRNGSFWRGTTTE